MQTIIPPFLKPGDTIAIAATARSVSHETIASAVRYMEGKGFRVFCDPDLFRVNRQFAGTEQERAELLNRLLGHEEIKAIWCARGGYGSARMADLIDWDLLRRKPKWIAGFSDVTVLLNQVRQQCSMASLHSSMPVFMHEKDGADLKDVELAFDSLSEALQGRFARFSMAGARVLNPGEMEAEVIGGNLSVLYSIMDSVSEADYSGKILFLEDLDEYYYHIDRMMLALKRSGRLRNLKGILVGSFISMHDHKVPFGYSVEEIIEQHCGGYGYPVVFGVNAGHHLQNITLPFGVHAKYKDGILTFANP